MSETWPQPHEGIRGTDMTGHWLLSLDDRAVPHREALIALGRNLRTATLVGSPAPVVRRMSDRIRRPEPGDLVVTAEVLHGRRDPEDRIMGLGIYLAGRKEWDQTDEEWAAQLAEEPAWADEERPTDTVFYIQYGPDPGDICRWHNSEAVVLPVQDGPFSTDAAALREDLGEGRTRATFTRDSLIGGLADSGFYLKGEPGPVPDGEHLVTVHVPSGAVTDVRDVAPAARTVRP